MDGWAKARYGDLVDGGWRLVVYRLIIHGLDDHSFIRSCVLCVKFTCGLDSMAGLPCQIIRLQSTINPCLRTHHVQDSILPEITT